ncbi:unnamed protein product [Rotaria sp. Silwood2]|nr:unnamed protein product [Rotaria sp. Silwood2]CAF2832467.1 unnamed protein product [Rotaria sp. Silwood2]CAF2976651.1 unnamed protein product [Rotaria sp. Silwood2]CAF4061487.1 unnamed protein product [Rotaria sp. Silwood2]
MAHSYKRVERFLDAAREPTKELIPIEGYEKTHLMTLEQSLQPMLGKLHNLETMIKIAMRNSRKPANGLTSDESAAIHLHTMQWPETYASLYVTLNEALRCENRECLIPWFPYLKLFFTALYKLPSFKGTIWRGVRGNFSGMFDEDIIWWGMSSCTEKSSMIENFLGVDGERTLLKIDCVNGKAIQAHSYFEKEEEILLMPGTYLQIVGKIRPSKNLNVVHLQEVSGPYQTIAAPFDTSSASANLGSLEPSVIFKEPTKVSTAPTTSEKIYGENCFTFFCKSVLEKADIEVLSRLRQGHFLN